MDHDLSKCKVLDWIYTMSNGWEQIIEIKCDDWYPIKCRDSQYSYLGYEANLNYQQPSAYIIPPSDWKVPPKPKSNIECLKKDTLIRVFNEYYPLGKLRYFKRTDENGIIVYPDGLTSLNSNGREEIWESWELIIN